MTKRKPWVEHGQSRPLGGLKPNPHNSRQHSDAQVIQIEASMGQWDWTVPMLIDDKGMILAGHGRQAAGIRKFGADYEVPVSIAHGWSEDQKRAYVIADNRLAELATWDEPLLLAELTELRGTFPDLELLGFSDMDFAALARPTLGKGDPEATPAPPEHPVSRLGDVWLLGGHRIICGDSTDAATVEKVLAGSKPHLMVTDPPYGVEYDAAFRNGIVRANGTIVGAQAIGKVLNDDRADWSEAWALFKGDVAYVWHAGVHASEVQVSLEATGFVVRSQIIWGKQQFAIGRGDYHCKHEPCWYVVRKGKKGHWAGDRSQTTLWAIDKPAKSETGHSTQKPVECMRRPIENNSKPGDAVYEPFSGSGTTIIAGEMTGRHVLAVELSETYVDVAVLRWQTYVGKAATLEGSGLTFEQVKAERVPA